jgi:hypothetical protein
MRKNYEKRVQEKWRKALKKLGINDNLYPNHKEDLFEYQPFKDGSLANVKLGIYKE